MPECDSFKDKVTQGKSTVEIFEATNSEYGIGDVRDALVHVGQDQDCAQGKAVLGRHSCVWCHLEWREWR